MISNKEIRSLYGERVTISRKGVYVLVHLDRPSKATVRKRTQEFDPKLFFCKDCPICQMLKSGGVIVFDDSIFTELEDLLE